MKEEKLQVFLEGVQKYFAQMIIGEELVVGTPYLVENKVPSAKDFTGVISISGKNKGIVYFTKRIVGTPVGDYGRKRHQ